MGDPLPLDDGGVAELDRGGAQVLEPARPVAEQDRHEVDVDAVEQAGVEALLGDLGTGDDHVLGTRQYAVARLETSPEAELVRDRHLDTFLALAEAAAPLLDRDKDFNGFPKLTTYRGAYSDDGVNPGWQPALTIKP